MKNAAGDTTHRCDICSSTFRRAEHLKRHSRSHTSERPFVCATCGKAFARSDILHRHELNHSESGDRPVNRLTTGTFRACRQCATARQRCTGELPCARCSKKSLDCTFPDGSQPLHPTPMDSAPTAPESRASEIISAPLDTPTHIEYNNFESMSGPAIRSIPEVHFQSHEIQSANYEVRMPSIASLVDQSPAPLADLPPANHHSTEHTRTMSHDSPRPVDIPSTLTWATPGQFNETGMDTPSFDAFYPQHFPSAPADLEEDWLNLSLNWIPLSMYPSPYGPDLEEEFKFILPSESSIYGGPDEGGTWQPANSAEGTLNRHRMSFTQFSETSNTPRSLNSASPSGDIGQGTEKRHSESTYDRPDFAVKRRKYRDAQMSSRSHIRFGFPSTHSNIIQSSPPSGKDFPRMPTGAWQIMYDHFRKLCLSDTSMFTPFTKEYFPQLYELNNCICLYIDHFHPRWPLVHVPSLYQRDVHWTLWLAVAAIGAAFGEGDRHREFNHSLQEFLRRAVVMSMEEDGQPDTFVAVMQTRILNLIGLSRADLKQHRALIPRFHVELSRYCLDAGLLQAYGQEGALEMPDSAEEPSKAWKTWIDAESRRRTGYFVWLIDSSLAYLSNSGPICSLDDARAPLPCAETLWAARNAQTWVELRSSLPQQPSLCSAMETMYLRKQVSPTLSETAHILIIHALYQKTWAVGKHLKSPFSDWRPNAKTRGFVATPSKDSFWLPSYPMYENWRNNACDCLDVLQWHANSVVARASGNEHHLMLHLHLARVVLLTPFQEIDDLCSSLLQRYGRSPPASFYVHDGSYQNHNPGKLPQIRKICWRWLREDQHKARLGALHAGSVFWHVRRYCGNTIFEPTAIYLASIVLWVYGSYRDSALSPVAAKTPKDVRPAEGQNGPATSHGEANAGQPTIEGQESLPQSSRAPSPSPSAGSELEPPKFIHLDRPCDDEMVQHFVRHGQKMACHMSNIGDICESPNRILLEGAKLLKSKLWQWGVSAEYYHKLKDLAALRKGG